MTHALNDESGFAETADLFLVLVGIADPYGGSDDALAATRDELGDARTTSFLSSVASRVDRDAPVDLPVARRDRGALERWLRDRGLGERARELAQRVAVPGLRLVPIAEDRPEVGSRLGGDGLLPPGETWPRTVAGRPLSFLAGVDLGQLPRDLPGTEVLPSTGWLLFFADLDDRGEALGFIGEPTRNDPGADARLLWVPPDVQPLVAEPPADLPRDPHVRMEEQSVTARSQLTLPDGYESSERLGLDFAEGEAYDEIAAALRYGSDEQIGSSIQGEDFDELHGTDFEELDLLRAENEEGFDGTTSVDAPPTPPVRLEEPDDWVLGAVTGVQGAEPEDDTILLLHLASIEFLDGGAIQFRIPSDALVEREWSRAVAEGDSC